MDRSHEKSSASKTKDSSKPREKSPEPTQINPKVKASEFLFLAAYDEIAKLVKLLR